MERKGKDAMNNFKDIICFLYYFNLQIYLKLIYSEKARKVKKNLPLGFDVACRVNVKTK